MGVRCSAERETFASACKAVVASYLASWLVLLVLVRSCQGCGCCLGCGWKQSQVGNGKGLSPPSFRPPLSLEEASEERGCPAHLLR